MKTILWMILRFLMLWACVFLALAGILSISYGIFFIGNLILEFLGPGATALLGVSFITALGIAVIEGLTILK